MNDDLDIGRLWIPEFRFTQGTRVVANQAFSVLMTDWEMRPIGPIHSAMA